MKPELFQIPWIHYGVKGYGFALMIGFLTGIYWAARRAGKVKGNPDLVLNLGFIALIFGVVGARAFYVVHYWQRSFAHRSWGDVINLTAGGLEFYGGFIGAMLFIIWFLVCHGRPVLSGLLAVTWSLLAVFVLVALHSKFAPSQQKASIILGIICAVIGFFILRALWRWARRAAAEKPVSLRMYLDIISPSLMWGLAFGRMGCFLNGCCWGGVCNDPHIHWTVQFPCASPAQYSQWEQRLATLPAALLYINPQTGHAMPIYRDLLTMSKDQIESGQRKLANARKDLADARARNAPPSELERVRLRLKYAQMQNEIVSPILQNAGMFGMTVPQLQDLAMRQENKSLHVHPAQVYDVINVMLMSFFLNAVFYRRKRHGVVFGLMWVLYPITRLILETIRADNPLDTAGLTASQGVSVLGLLFAAVWFYGIYKLPLRSPCATPYEPPPEPAK